MYGERDILFSAVSASGYSQRCQSVSLYGHRMAIVPVCTPDVGLLNRTIHTFYRAKTTFSAHKMSCKTCTNKKIFKKKKKRQIIYSDASLQR